MQNLSHDLRDWLIQRASALIMAVYSILMAAMLLIYQPAGYEGWKSLMGTSWIKLMTLLFLLSLIAHAWIGVKDVLVDYVKLQRLHQALLAVAALSLIFYAAWSLQIMWNV